jgi:hypothetical protein
VRNKPSTPFFGLAMFSIFHVHEVLTMIEQVLLEGPGAPDKLQLFALREGEKIHEAALLPSLNNSSQSVPDVVVAPVKKHVSL